MQQEQLVRNINRHLEGFPELRGDLAEIHRIGAIPRYRGPLPPEERVRGLPHNPAESTLMMTKLWNYVMEGKMLVCTAGGVTPGGEIPLFSVDHCRQKAPRQNHFLGQKIDMGREASQPALRQTRLLVHGNPDD